MYTTYVYRCQNWRTGEDRTMWQTLKVSRLWSLSRAAAAHSSWNISRAGELWRAIFISAGDRPPANLICTLSICYIDKYQPTAATLRHGLLAGDFIILDCWFAFLSILVENLDSANYSGSFTQFCKFASLPNKCWVQWPPTATCRKLRTGTKRVCNFKLAWYLFIYV